MLGEKIGGIIEARSLIVAKITLRNQGIIAPKIVKKHYSFASKNRKFLSKKIIPADINLFIKHLGTLNKAGIPLLQSLTIICNGAEKNQLKALVTSIKRDIETGLMLADSLNKYPVFFNALLCNMIRAGEHAGALDIMFEKIVCHQERIANVKQKIYKALTYPCAVMLIAIFVTTGLLMFVIPEFESLFISFGAELPVFTRLVINTSIFFNKYWFAMISISCIISYGAIYAYRYISTFTHYIQLSILKLPTVGTLLQKACIARFSRTLSITFAAGIPLTEALKEAAGSMGNRLYANAVFSIREDVSQGQSIQHAMQKTHLFSKFVIQMVAIGEECGSLDAMFNKIADFYEEEIDNTIDTLNSLLEPVIMAVLGLLVGSLVIAMYLPILKLGSGV